MYADPPTFPKIQSSNIHLKVVGGYINLEQRLVKSSPRPSYANEDTSVKLSNSAIGAKSGCSVFPTEIGMIMWQQRNEWFIKNAAGEKKKRKVTKTDRNTLDSNFIMGPPVGGLFSFKKSYYFVSDSGHYIFILVSAINVELARFSFCAFLFFSSWIHWK